MTNTISPAARKAATLRHLCGGAVHLPSDESYDRARTPWNLAVPQHPAAVAYPGDPREVAEVVRAAADAGLRVAPQATGHNAGPLRSLEDAVLLRTSAMTEVQIDPVRRTARVGAGALWLDVVEAAAPHGLAALHGSAPDVGVVGYSLGGGIGWYARSLGLQAHSIVGAELVTADGTVRRVDAETDPELLWALRGGGGSFGVVTALEFTLYPIATAYAGLMAWDSRHAESVVRRFTEWAPEAADNVTTSLRLLKFPPAPDVPEPMRGREMVIIDGAVIDSSDDRSGQLLAPLRALRPELDTWDRVPAASLAHLHLDPEQPMPAVSRSGIVTTLPATGVTDLLAAAGPGSGSSLMMVELRQLGGALARHRADFAALPGLPGQYALYLGAVAMDPQSAALGERDAERVLATVRPYLDSRAYLNFVEQAIDPSVGYPADSWARLRRLRSRLDPGGLFVANHPIPGDDTPDR